MVLSASPPLNLTENTLSWVLFVLSTSANKKPGPLKDRAPLMQLTQNNQREGSCSLAVCQATGTRNRPIGPFALLGRSRGLPSGLRPVPFRSLPFRSVPFGSFRIGSLPFAYG